MDLEEFGVFYGLDNFELEIYEVTKKQSEDGENEEILHRIKDLEEVNKLFHIKTDEDVKDVEVKTGRKSNVRHCLWDIKTKCSAHTY